MSTLLIAIVLTICIAPIVGKAARVLSVVSKRTSFGQYQAIPLWGGVPMMIAIVVSAYISNADLLQAPIVVACVLYTILGALDDVFDLRPINKLILQTLCAVYIIAFFYTDQHILLSLFCVSWMVLVINAFNFIDGADGLATGYALILFSWFILIGDHSVYIFGLIGVCIGFLPFNAQKARLYLGDSGSHMLGCSVAFLSIPNFYLGYPKNIEWSIVDLLPFILMICDIFFVIITRNLRRVPITIGGTDHIYHRLSRLVGGRTATMLILSLSAFLALISLLLRELPHEIQLIVMLLLCGIFLMSLYKLALSTNHYFLNSTTDETCRLDILHS